MIAQFPLRLLFGMSLMWVLMPRRQVTSGFFRIQMLVALGLSVLAVLTLGRLDLETDAAASILPHSAAVAICSVLAGCAFLGSVMWTLERRTAGTVFVFVIAGLSAAVLLLSGPSAESLASPLGALWALSELSTGSMLGGATTAMLLGHWYLTAPTMSIAPLARLNAYFGLAGLVRLSLSAVGLFVAWGEIAGQLHWTWLALRWLAGIVGPLVVAVMVWRILKYRNTQSATGVLFVGVILTFIGELTATLLYHELSRPL